MRAGAQAGWLEGERKFHLEVKSVNSYNSSFELLVKDLHKLKKQGYSIALLCGSRTRAQRLAKDLQNEELSAFYGEDYDRVISPRGNHGGLRPCPQRGFEYPLIKFAVIAESDIFGREQKKKKRRKPTAVSGSRIFPSCLSEILWCMKSTVWEFTGGSKGGG